MGDGIHAQSQAADDGDAIGRQFAAQIGRRFPAVGGRLAGANHRHGPGILRPQLALNVEQRRAGVNSPQPGRIFRVMPS